MFTYQTKLNNLKEIVKVTVPLTMSIIIQYSMCFLVNLLSHAVLMLQPYRVF